MSQCNPLNAAKEVAPAETTTAIDSIASLTGSVIVIVYAISLVYSVLLALDDTKRWLKHVLLVGYPMTIISQMAVVYLEVLSCGESVIYSTASSEPMILVSISTGMAVLAPGVMEFVDRHGVKGMLPV